MATNIEQRMMLLVEKYKLIIPKVNPKNFIVRIANGENFWKSDRFDIWGISTIGAKTLKKSCEKGDHIWFCTGNSGGQLVAVATFDRIIPRFKGIDKYDNLTNKDFGWVGEEWDCNYLIKYNNRYNLELDKIYSGIKGACATRYIDNIKNVCPTGILLDDIYYKLSTI